MSDLFKHLIYILFFTFTWSVAATASDLEKEQRWLEQVSDGLVVGEACSLDAKGTPFFGIYTPADDDSSENAVILLHGMGAHPDWPDVINPLRSDLPEHNWSTLSIQLPVLGNHAPLKDYLPLFDEVAPRIDAAIENLRQRGAKNIVLIGHSLGASMAASYLAGTGKQNINGFVAIGMNVIQLDDKVNSAVALEIINIPILDLYGSRDLRSVLGSAKQRSRAAKKAGNKQYRQTMLEGADHFFTGLEDALTRTVYGWLKTTFKKTRKP